MQRPAWLNTTQIAPDLLAYIEALERAVADEREACAKIADKLAEDGYDWDEREAANHLASLIRNRTS
jgi:hypothetical protein